MSDSTAERINVRVLFADEGGFHSEVISLPAGGLGDYDRLIDFVREDEAVLRECYLDVDRLCSARQVEEEDDD